MNPLLPVFVLTISSISWGLTWLPLKYFHGIGINGVSLVFLAYGIGALALLPVFIKQAPQWRNNRRTVILIAVLGGYSNLAFSYSMIYGDVVRAMVLFYLCPVWATLGGRFFLKENVDALRWLGVGLALFGAALIVGAFNLALFSFTFVDFVAVSAGFAFAMTNVTFRAYAQMPIASNVAAVFFGCTAMAGGLIIFGVAPPPTVEFEHLTAIAAYGVFWILVASMASQWAVTQMEASRSAVIIVMELVAAAVSSAWIGGNALTMTEIFGGLLVVSATLLETTRPALPNKAIPAPVSKLPND